MIEIYPTGYSGDMAALVGRIAMADAGYIWIAPRNPVRVEKVTGKSIQGREVGYVWNMDRKSYAPDPASELYGPVTFRTSSIRAVCDTPEEVCGILNMTEINGDLFKAFKEQAIANLMTLTNKE